MGSGKNSQHTVKVPDGTAAQDFSKRNLRLNRASAHHSRNNNKAAAFFTSDQCWEMSHPDTSSHLFDDENNTSMHFLLLLQSTAQVKRPQISMFLSLRTWCECEVCKVKGGCETVCACVCVHVCICTFGLCMCLSVLAKTKSRAWNQAGEFIHISSLYEPCSWWDERTTTV